MKILFEIVADQTNVGVALDELRARVRELNKELAKPGTGQSRTRELREEVVRAKNEIGKLTEEQRRLNREFKATQVPKDSLAGLRLEYGRLIEQVRLLTEAERNSAFGQNLIRSAAGVKKQVDEIEQAVGRFTGNVGNYRQALLSVGDLVTGGLATGGVVVAVQKVIDIMKLGVEQAVKYEQALDDLSALTGLQGAELDNLENIAKDLRSINVQGVEITNTGTDILNALKLVGGARPELLKNADALAEVTRQAIILQKASGEDLASSVRALTTVLGQFNEPASASGRIINELAAGAKEGSSEIPQTTEALEKFGTVAKTANVTTSESIALIELLADRQLKGSEAGNQLKNVLTRLAAADVLPPNAQAQFDRLGISVEVLKDSTLPLEVRLKELSKANGDLAALTKIFGVENLTAATIITSGLPKYQALQKSIEGTNEALTQASIRADNTGTAFENLQNKAQNQLTDTFTKGTPTTRALAEALTFLVDKLNIVEGAVNAVIGPISGLINGISETYNGIVSLFNATDEPLGAFFDVQGVNADVKDLTASLLEQADKQKLVEEASAGAEVTISSLQRRIKELKRELSGTQEGTPEFQRLSGQLKDAQEQLARLKKEAGFTNLKGQADAAAGSVQFFQDQVRALEDRLNRTAPDNKGFAALVRQLEQARALLAAVQKQIKAIQDGDRIRASLPFIPTSQDTPPAPGFVPEDFAAAEKAAADKAAAEKAAARQKDINEETAYQQRLFEINKEAAADEQKLRQEAQEKRDKDEADRREKEEKEAKDRRERARDAAIEVGAAAAQAVLQIERDRLDRQTQTSIEALNAEYERRIELAQGNAVLQDKLRAEQEKKRLQIEKQAARERQKIAIGEALIQGALNALKGFFSGGLIGALEAGALTLLQVALIKSQQFARGGVVKFGRFGGQPHSAGGTKGVFSDGTRVEVEKDEVFAVVNKHNAPLLRHLSRVNSAGGNGRAFFADGGVLNFTPQIALPADRGPVSVQVQAQATFTEDQIAALSENLAKRNAEEISRQVRQALADGIDDANRRMERQKLLTENRTA